MNDEKHKWAVCFSISNSTSLQQASDSVEQEGCSKMYCSEYKNKLTNKKIELGIFLLNITPINIRPIINYTWQRFYARIQTNIKARQSKGWVPLNKMLLSHPDNVSTKLKSTHPIDPQSSTKYDIKQYWYCIVILVIIS